MSTQTDDQRSFIHKINKTRPRTEPCGTPYSSIGLYLIVHTYLCTLCSIGQICVYPRWGCKYAQTLSSINLTSFITFIQCPKAANEWICRKQFHIPSKSTYKLGNEFCFVFLLKIDKSYVYVFITWATLKKNISFKFDIALQPWHETALTCKDGAFSWQENWIA